MLNWGNKPPEIEVKIEYSKYSSVYSKMLAQIRNKISHKMWYHLRNADGYGFFTHIVLGVSKEDVSVIKTHIENTHRYVTDYVFDTKVQMEEYEKQTGEHQEEAIKINRILSKYVTSDSVLQTVIDQTSNSKYLDTAGLKKIIFHISFGQISMFILDDQGKDTNDLEMRLDCIIAEMIFETPEAETLFALSL